MKYSSIQSTISKINWINRVWWSEPGAIVTRLETHKRRGKVAPPSLSPWGPQFSERVNIGAATPVQPLPNGLFVSPSETPFSRHRLHSLFSPICPPLHPGSGIHPSRNPPTPYTPPQSASTSIWCASIFHLRDNTRWNDLINSE